VGDIKMGIGLGVSWPHSLIPGPQPQDENVRFFEKNTRRKSSF